MDGSNRICSFFFFSKQLVVLVIHIQKSSQSRISGHKIITVKIVIQTDILIS